MTVNELVVKLGVDMSSLEKGLEQASNKLNSIGKKLNMSVTAPLTALAGASIYVASNYNASMNRVAAVSQSTAAEMAQLSAQAKELGRTTRYSAVEAADAMGFLGMAGFKANEIIGAMPSTLQLAAAAQMDLAQAADITSNILTGYGMDIEELSAANDVLVASFTGANTDLAGLGVAMKYVGPVASGLGFTFKDTAAMVGLLGNAGIQGSQAGTTLRRVLSELASPTKDTARLIQELGLNLYEADGSIRSFVEIMREFERVGAGTTEIIEMFGVKGSGMAAAMSQGSEVLEAFNQVLDNSGGLAERVSNQQMEGLSGALIKMRSALEGASLTIGEKLTPAVMQITGAITKLSASFSTMSDRSITGLMALAAVLAASGPIMIGLSLIAAHPLVAATTLVLSGIAWAVTMFISWKKEANNVNDAMNNIARTSSLADIDRQIRDVEKSLGDWQKRLEEIQSSDYSGQGLMKSLDTTRATRQVDQLTEALDNLKVVRAEMASGGIGPELPTVDAQAMIDAARITMPTVDMTPLTQQVALDIDPYALTEAEKLKKFPTDVADQWLEDQERIRASQALTDSFVVDSSSRAAALQIATEQSKTAMMAEQQAIRDQMLSDSLSRWGDQFAEFTSATIMNWDSIGKTMVDGVEKQASAWQKLGIIFSQVAKKMLADMAALIARALVLKALTTMLGLPTSGAGGGGSFGGFGAIGGWLAGKLKVPGFAEGGIVTRPTLAVVGEGGEHEAVIPLSKLGQMTQPIALTVPVTVDGREIARASARYMPDELRRHGVRP